MLKILKKTVKSTLVGVMAFTFVNTNLDACTGVRLTAQDGSVVVGRSMEWGAFDLNSRVTIIPRGYHFQGLTPDGLNGKKWTAKYGIVGLDMINKLAFADAINEEGLSAGLFYHPDYAKYPKYSKKNASNTITAIDFISYILSNYKNVDEVKKGIKNLQVVGVNEPLIGKIIEAHFMVTDAKGKSIVIEWEDGKMKIYDAPLGVITNSPYYDWHLTNLRNYVNLSQVAIPSKKIQDMNFAPLGAGSGMIGLPGDFTPPSRFVRAVAFSQSARKTPNSKETMYELFRILDNFNLGVGNAEGSEHAKGKTGLRSSTIWTIGYETTNKVMYYHTQHNRQVRMFDLKKIDFSNIGNKIIYLPLDKKKEQYMEDITLKK